MIKLYDSDITDILPSHFTKAPEVIALGYALKQAVRRLLQYSRTTSVYAAIDDMPDNVLDLLALELNTQYYEDDLDIETKRKLVKNTLIWYMSAGTTSAVQELVSVVFGSGEVAEWFDYGDEPYYFKLLVDAVLTPRMNDQFSSILSNVKNIRSRLRVIEIHRETSGTVYAGGGINLCHRPAAIIDGYKTDGLADGSTDINGDFTQTYRPTAIMDGYRAEESAGGEYESAVGALGIMNAKAPAIAETLPT